MPRWNMWFIGTFMGVFALIFAGLAVWFWIHTPHTSNDVLGTATFAIPFLAAWYLDRVCPRRASATPDGLSWTSFVLAREHHAPWDAITSVQTVVTKTNDKRGDVWLSLQGRIGKLVLPGQMIDRDDVLAALRTNCAGIVC